MEMTQARDKCFDDIANYLVTFISLTLTTELYVQGYASPYAPNHQAKFDAKQVGKRLILYPHTLLNEMFASRWPTRLVVVEEPVQLSASASLDLDVFERPLIALEQSMIVNYFERERPQIETRYHPDPAHWPADWNFARVVRNSAAHNNEVCFRTSSAAPVTWRALTYAPADDGRKVLHGDLWPADLIYLLMDLDAHLG
jgi:hypothetical protein